MATQEQNLQFLVEFQLRGTRIWVGMLGDIKKKYNQAKDELTIIKKNTLTTVLFMIKRFKLGEAPSGKQESNVHHCKMYR